MSDPKRAAASHKPRLDLLLDLPMVPLAGAMAHGADKYGRTSWRDGDALESVYLGAIMRHTAAHAAGEDFDPDSGFEHLAHVAASALILLDMTRRGIADRDVSRPRESLGLTLSQIAAEIRASVRQDRDGGAAGCDCSLDMRRL